MVTRHHLSAEQHQAMLEMLEGLTPAERLLLEDPEFITEDEADIIVCHRRADEETVPAEEVLAEFGIPLRRRSA